MSDFTYKGKTTEELQAMNMDELSGIMKSSIRRKLKRGLTEDHKKLLNRLRKKDNIKTHLRDMVVLPEMIGKTIQIHSGKEFVPVTINGEMIGHLLGEFAHTRKRVAHSSPGMGATRSSKYVPLK